MPHLHPLLFIFQSPHSEARPEAYSKRMNPSEGLEVTGPASGILSVSSPHRVDMDRPSGSCPPGPDSEMSPFWGCSQELIPVLLSPALPVLWSFRCLWGQGLHHLAHLIFTTPWGGSSMYPLSRCGNSWLQGAKVFLQIPVLGVEVLVCFFLLHVPVSLHNLPWSVQNGTQPWPVSQMLHYAAIKRMITHTQMTHNNEKMLMTQYSGEKHDIKIADTV